MPDLVGQQIDQYRIDALIGQGGMGAVYRAYDVHLARTVALKVTHAHLSEQKHFQERFMQEARAAARLKHPSIVDVYNFGTLRGMLYVVLAYVPDGSLGAYVRDLQENGRSVDLREMLELLAQVADALHYAHRQGVVHRDIKPDNVLLERLDEDEAAAGGRIRAVVTDFGLAKLLEGGLQSASGSFMGTLPYMSPEQCLGGVIDGRSDLYSLGVMVYQLATGRLPFDIKSPTDAVVKHMKETPPLPRVANPAVPSRLNAIARKAIAKEREDRFQSGSHMARALRAAADSLSPEELLDFAPPERVYAIETGLDSRPPAVRPVRPAAVTGESALPTAEFQLIVTRDGEDPSLLALDRLEYTIGRGKHFDISLDAVGVSREHARLERTLNGWQVVDLQSTNGTYVEKNRLLAGVPEPWEQESILRIGPYVLRWRRNELENGTRATAGSTMATGVVRGADGRVALVANPTEVVVEPGSTERLALQMLNQGVSADHYAVVVSGIPEAWVTVPDRPVALQPGRQESAEIAFHPPRTSASTAGSHPFQIEVRVPQMNQAAVVAPIAVLNGRLTVSAFVQYSAELRPAHLTDGESCRLTVRSEGNVPLTVVVSGRDPLEAIDFTIPAPDMTVAPGARETMALTPTARHRPLVGAQRQLPFTVHVSPTDPVGAEPQSLPGLLSVRPRLQRFLPLLPALLAWVVI